MSGVQRIQHPSGEEARQPHSWLQAPGASGVATLAGLNLRGIGVRDRGKHVVEKGKTPMELWRIIEVCPAYFGPQLATYTKTPQ